METNVVNRPSALRVPIGLLLLAALFLPWSAHAQNDSLTVADGVVTNKYIPIYGMWVDEDQQNQILYPASMLSELTGGEITSLTYYMSSTASSQWGTTVTIRMKEVSNTTIGTLMPTTDATVVWTGTVNGQNSEQEFILSTPYVYLGGNLLVEFSTTAATWSSASWYGDSHVGGSCYSYNGSEGTQDFLPKTKFVFQAAEGICFPPTNLSATTSGSDANISWTAGDVTSWEIAWGAPGFNPDNETTNIDNVSTNNYTISNLNNGLYDVYVRTVCDTNNSNWVMSSFMIGGCPLTIVGTDSYGDGWNGGSLNVVQGNITIGTLSVSGSTGTLTINVAANLPVSFVWNSGSYDSEASFEIYNFDNVLLYSASHPSAGTVYSVNSPCSSCFAPRGVNVDSLTSDYARVVWNGSSNSYGVIWGESEDVADNNGTYITVTDNYIELGGLSSGTGYTLQLWSVCDNSETSDTVTCIFATIGDPVSDFPYVTGFEAGEDMSWSFVNDVTNKWSIGTGEAHSGINGLYISNDEGATNTYTKSSTQFSYAYRVLDITESGQYVVSFDWKANGESSWDYLRAWIAPDTATFTAGLNPGGTTSSNSYSTTTPTGWIDLGGKMNLSTNWQTVEATPSLNAGTYFIVFMWANDNSGGSQPPAAIDNIVIHELTCPQPTDLTAVPHSYSVDLAWEAVGDESQWEIIVSDTIVEYSSSESYTVQGLDAYTLYDFSVRAICGEGDTSFATTINGIRTLVSCPAPSNLVVDSATENELFISWVANGEESEWVVTINDSVVDNATDNSYYFSDLDPNTTYNITVMALCGSDDTSTGVSLTARTLSGAPISDFPYTCDFELGDDDMGSASDWVLENGNETNYWMVGTATNNGGSRAMYITNDGSANSYNIESTSYAFAYATFQFQAGEYAYSYDWKAGGESSYDFIRAAVVPISTPITAGSYCGFNNTSAVPTGGIAIDGGRLNLQDNWQTQTGTFTITNSGLYNVVFMWRNDYSTGVQPPAAIDNISISQNSCPTPTGFAVDTIEAFQATLDWTPGGNESEWAVRAVSPTFTDAWQSTTTVPYTYTGLASGTSYVFELRAVCGYGDSSFAVSCTGNTPITCPAPTDFSVVVSGDTADFSWTDTNGTSWELAYGPVGFSPDTALMVDYPTTTSLQLTNLNAGIYDAYVRTSCEGDDYSVWVGPVTVNTMPSYIMSSQGVDTLYACNLTIYDAGGMAGNYSSNSESYLYVYPSDPGSVLQISGYSNTEGTYDYLRIKDLVTGEVIFIDNSTPNGQNIPVFTAFGGVELYFHSDVSVVYSGYEVNVSCIPAPDCMPIGNINVVATTAGSAYLTWSTVMADAYNGAVVEYRDTSMSMNWTSVSTTEDFIILTGLNDGALYEVRIAALCDNNSLSSYEYAWFNTDDLGCIYDQSSSINATVGNGTSSSSHLPGYSLYNYSYTQQFFKASEIGGSGQITQITLTPIDITNQRTMEIYMGQSNDTAATSFITPDGLTCVYNGGPIPLTAGQPVTFDLTTPFSYSDTSSLVVIFRDLTGTWQSGNSWQSDEAWPNASRYIYQDASAYSVPQSGFTGNATSLRNKITFHGGVCIGNATCADPYAMVTAVDAHSVTLTWIPGASETSWNVEYRIAGYSNWITAATGVTSTTYTITNLNSSTNYEARIVSSCTEAVYESVVQFATDCVCFPVIDLSVVGNTMSSITLDWNDYSPTDNSWIVSYSTSPLNNPMTGNCSVVTSHPYTVNGLTAYTDYWFYVRNDCGSGDSSMWEAIGPVRPGSWIMVPNSTDTLYMCGGTIYDDGGVAGSYSSSQNSTIILHPDAQGVLVSVSGSSYTEGSYDYLTIYDGVGTSGAVLWTDNGVSSNQTFGPIESNSGSLTITFHSDVSVNYDGFEINVSCVSASCRILNLGLDPNAGESGSQLAITWDAASAATQYQVEYGVSGFTLGQGQMMTTVNNHAVITGLESLTNYDVYVRSICTGGDTGNWASVTLMTAMCDNSLQVYNYDPSQATATSNHFPIGYSYYNYSYVQTIIPSTQLANLTGEITAFAFNALTTTSGSSEFDNMTVWMANVSEEDLGDGFILPDQTTHLFRKVIDDASFSYTESGLQVHTLDSSFAWDGVSNILVAVNRENGSYASSPNFAAHEDTIHRARYVYNDDTEYDYTTVSGGTSSTTIGDILLISCGSGCARPSGVYASNVDYGNATLNWTGSATDYEVSVKPITVGTWPAATAVSNAHTYTATGLTAATRYQFRVRAVCDAAEGSVSDWVVGNFVTDSLPCLTPGDLHTTELGYTTATLAWDANASQNQWSIHVWNSAGGNDYETTSNPYTVTGLNARTTYYAAVKTICGGGAAESEYSDTIQFTTATCDTVRGVSVSNITSNSAVVNWISTDASRYIIEYGDQNFSSGTGHTVVVDNATSYTITGLENNYDYSVFVKAVCDEGVEGAWSSQVDFTTLESGTAVTTVEGGMSLSIYPNPTNDVTTVAVSGVNGEVSITVVDMNGRTVKSDVIKCDGDCAKRMELSGLAQGAYFVRVNGENLNMVRKLVVK